MGEWLVMAYDFENVDIEEVVTANNEMEAILKTQNKYNNDDRYYNWEAEEIK